MLKDELPGHQPRRQWCCPGPARQTELKRPAKNAHNFRRQTHQRKAKVEECSPEMGQTDGFDGRREAGSQLSSNSESAVKEPRSAEIWNPNTQESRDPAFLQNRILAQPKSQQHINRFRIVHRRLDKEIANKKDME
jgi:hypothetical protein